MWVFSRKLKVQKGYHLMYRAVIYIGICTDGSNIALKSPKYEIEETNMLANSFELCLGQW
jgi:hypothetical protein